jgi:hypothetical protein
VNKRGRGAASFIGRLLFNFLLLLVCVALGGFVTMLAGLDLVALSGLRMMRRFFIVSLCGFLGCVTVLLCGFIVMFCSFFVMFL